MPQQLKKYLSILFLILFLFPLLEKGVHELEHRSDEHCTSSEKHFHPLEHSCAICEFTLSQSENSEITDFQFYIFVHHFPYQPFVINVNVYNAFQHLPSRAPPIA